MIVLDRLQQSASRYKNQVVFNAVITVIIMT